MSFLLPSPETRAKMLETYYHLFNVPLVDGVASGSDASAGRDEESTVEGSSREAFGGAAGGRPSMVSALKLVGSNE
jgi:hypothetical protein